MFRCATMGDSLTAPYSGTRASGGNKSWMQLLFLLRPQLVSFQNHASPGATTGSILTGGQPNKVVSDSISGKVDFSTYEGGGNDQKNYASTILLGIYGPYVSECIQHIEAALTKVTTTKCKQVVMTVVDVGLCPSVQKQIDGLTFEFSVADSQVNDQIKTYAAGKKIPLVDTYQFGHDLANGFTMSGVSITPTMVWSPDGFHPSGIMQGLVANMILEICSRQYDLDITDLRLSDQEILKQVGITSPSPFPTYFDISEWIITY